MIRGMKLLVTAAAVLAFSGAPVSAQGVEDVEPGTTEELGGLYDCAKFFASVGGGWTRYVSTCGSIQGHNPDKAFRVVVFVTRRAEPHLQFRFRGPIKGCNNATSFFDVPVGLYQVNSYITKIVPDTNPGGC